MSIRENVKAARRVVQQRRLVNEDFPWLWAVRNKWYFGRGVVVAANADHHLERFLAQRQDRFAEVWIRYGAVETLTEVKKVEYTRHHTCWAHALMESIAVGKAFLNIVIVEPIEIPVGAEGMTVYRPPKGLSSFNPLIVQVKQSVI